MSKTVTDKLILVLLIAAALLIVTGGSLAFISLHDQPGQTVQTSSTASPEAEEEALSAALDAAVAAGEFLPGIYVDGEALGGLTLDEAKAVFIQKTADLESAVDIEIVSGENRWQLMGTDQIQLTDDRDAVLDEAFALGRGTDRQQNLSDLVALQTQSREFDITRTYRINNLDAIIQLLRQSLDNPAQDAQILGYDLDQGEFQFEPEQTGTVVDAQALANEIEQVLRTADFPARITVPMIQQEPEVTVTQLESDYRLMSTFSTTAKNDRARNTNISLALESFNGVILEPGEEFSINEATGERSQAKGYQVAGVILDGASSEDLGGGVCQASSTLFNAVARAGLKITERHPHSWPSDYIGAGFDAMINYPESDFRFVNSSEGRIYLFSSFDWDTRKLTVQIFGKPLYDEALKVDLTHECVETIPEPDAIITRDATRPANDVEVTRNGRSGSRWITRRVFYLDGVQVDSEELCTSYYRPIASRITVGTQDPGVAPSLPTPIQ